MKQNDQLTDYERQLAEILDQREKLCEAAKLLGIEVDRIDKAFRLAALQLQKEYWELIPKPPAS